MKTTLNNLTEITMPCHWDKDIIDEIVSNSKKDIAVKEIYGVLSGGGPVGHGRSRKSVVFVSKERAIKFRQYLKKIGLRFTYLLNAPFEVTNTKKQKNKLNSYLSWVLFELKPDD